MSSILDSLLLLFKDDVYTHLYTLVVQPDGKYEVLIDNEKAESGSLEDDWDFLPPKEIKVRTEESNYTMRKLYMDLSCHFGARKCIEVFRLSHTSASDYAIFKAQHFIMAGCDFQFLLL